MELRVDVIASPEVDAAIMRVLAAEQAARADVDRCGRAAEQAREDARARARLVAERAARRVARIHRWADRTIAERLAVLGSQRAALTAEPCAAGSEANLQRAVERLADDLTGAGA